MNEVLVKADDLKNIMEEILTVFHVDKEVIHHTVKGLVQTSLRGVDSHGVRLFPHYVRALKAGGINGNPSYAFEQTGDSTGKLDADHTFGHAAGAQAMKEALALAKESGIGAVAVLNSTHFGAAAYYGLIAAEADMIGISMTHADALMLSSGGRRAFFGTNPICVTAPVDGEEPFCLDMATTKINWNKVKMHRETGEALGDGVAADREGNVTINPDDAASLLPIGDYKGFGLAMVVDIFCSLLTGAPFGAEIKAMYTTPLEEKRFLGQFFMAVNIEKFVHVATFKQRLKQYMDQIRSEPAKNPENAIMVAGDPEKKTFKERSASGIPLNAQEINQLEQLAREYGIEMIGVSK